MIFISFLDELEQLLLEDLNVYGESVYENDSLVYDGNCDDNQVFEGDDQQNQIENEGENQMFEGDDHQNQIENEGKNQVFEENGQQNQIENEGENQVFEENGQQFQNENEEDYYRILNPYVSALIRRLLPIDENGQYDSSRVYEMKYEEDLVFREMTDNNDYDYGTFIRNLMPVEQFGLPRHYEEDDPFENPPANPIANDFVYGSAYEEALLFVNWKDDSQYFKNWS